MSIEFATRPPEVRPEFADIVREEPVQYAQPTQSRLERAVNSRFDRLMLQSGLTASPPGWLLLSVFCGATVGGVAFLLTKALVPFGIFACVGVLIPMVLACHFRDRRQSVMLEQLPDAIDQLARLSQTGRNLASSLEHVAADSPQPIAKELSSVAERIAGGATIESALHGLNARSGLPGVAMLSTVLSVNSTFGGELSGPLFDLADDVRDQLVQRERERAIIAEGHWPAGALILLPLATGLIFLSRESAAIATVLDSVVGRIILCAAAVAWCLGSIIVLRIVRQVSR